jgi:hypothetical protein
MCHQYMVPIIKRLDFIVQVPTTKGPNFGDVLKIGIFFQVLRISYVIHEFKFKC